MLKLLHDYLVRFKISKCFKCFNSHSGLNICQCRWLLKLFTYVYYSVILKYDYNFLLNFKCANKSGHLLCSLSNFISISISCPLGMNLVIKIPCTFMNIISFTCIFSKACYVASPYNLIGYFKMVSPNTHVNKFPELHT